MKNLKDLFRVIELTRSQPQYGYALAGIAKDKLSNLAEHHYLVTFIAWQLAANLEKAGAQIDVRKVLEYALVHDLGELLAVISPCPMAGKIQKQSGLQGRLRQPIRSISPGFLAVSPNLIKS